MKDNMGELDKKLKALKNENMKLEEELDLAEKDLDFQLEKLVREKCSFKDPMKKFSCLRSEPSTEVNLGPFSLFTF